MSFSKDKKILIDTIRISGNKVRNVLIVLSIASILSFSGIWNSLHSSWVNSNSGTYKTLANELDYCINNLKGATHLQKPKTSKLIEYYEKFKDEKRDYLCTPEFYLIHSKSYIDITKEISIKQFIKLKKLFDDQYELYFQLRGQLQLFTKIPVLGISVDNNDLALFSGFAFCLIFIWLRHTLEAEKRTLKIYFSKSTPDNHQDMFELASLQQIFTIPKNTREKNYKRYFRSSFLLITLPIIVQSVIAANFYDTFKFGEFINPTNAYAITIIGTVFIFLLIFLFNTCRIKLIEIEDIWSTQWDLVSQINKKNPDILLKNKN